MFAILFTNKSCNIHILHNQLLKKCYTLLYSDTILNFLNILSNRYFINITYTIKVSINYYYGCLFLSFEHIYLYLH